MSKIHIKSFKSLPISTFGPSCTSTLSCRAAVQCTRGFRRVSSARSDSCTFNALSRWVPSNFYKFKKVFQGNVDQYKKFKCAVESPPRRKHMVFLGGSVLADLMKDNPNFWITRSEYEEQGIRCLAKLSGGKWAFLFWDEKPRNSNCVHSAPKSSFLIFWSLFNNFSKSSYSCT